MNTLVTLTHIAFIAGYLLIYIFVLVLNIDQQDINQRLLTSVFFFTGLLDLFLSFMLWFILYDKKQPSFIRDTQTKTSYPVLTVDQMFVPNSD